MAYEERKAKERKAEAMAVARETRWDGNKAPEEQFQQKPAETDRCERDESDDEEEPEQIVQKPAPTEPAPKTRDRIAERAGVSRYKAEQAIAVKKYDEGARHQPIEGCIERQCEASLATLPWSPLSVTASNTQTNDGCTSFAPAPAYFSTGHDITGPL